MNHCFGGEFELLEDKNYVIETAITSFLVLQTW
jgi:hypothetical protein